MVTGSIIIFGGIWRQNNWVHLSLVNKHQQYVSIISITSMLCVMLRLIVSYVLRALEFSCKGGKLHIGESFFVRCNKYNVYSFLVSDDNCETLCDWKIISFINANCDILCACINKRLQSDEPKSHLTIKEFINWLIHYYLFYLMVILIYKIL